jgi:hypothetical protein
MIASPNPEVDTMVAPGHPATFLTELSRHSSEIAQCYGQSDHNLLRADEMYFAVGSMLDIPKDISHHPLYTYNPIFIVPLCHPLLQCQKVL